MAGPAIRGFLKIPWRILYSGNFLGAALGAAIGIVLHFSGNIAGLSGTAFLAFAGALLTVFLVYSISRTGRKVPIASLILSGIAVNQSLSAFMSLIMLFHQQSMDQIMFWTMGSLNGKGWNQIFTILPYVILGVILLMTSARELDIMLLGEDTAVQLGVNVEFVKKKVLIVSSIGYGGCGFRHRHHRLCGSFGSPRSEIVYRTQAPGADARLTCFSAEPS